MNDKPIKAPKPPIAKGEKKGLNAPPSATRVPPPPKKK